MRRYVLLLAVLVGVILLAVPNARQAATINLWSLRYAAEAHNLPRSQAALPPPPNAHSRATLWQALRAIDNGDGQKALTLLEPLAAQGDRFALQLMGCADEALGDFSAATQIWRQTGNEIALFRVGESATEVGDLDAALEAYSAAWELDPAGRSTANLADFLWREKGDPAAATAILQQSIDEYPFSRFHLGWFRTLGDTLVDQQRWAEAGAAYEHFLTGIPDEFPDEWHVRVKLGWAYYELGSLEAALAEFQRAIAADPDRASSYFDLAQAYYLSGQLEPAMVAVEQAMQLDPTNLRVVLQAGEIYERAGETEKAIAVYRQILALDPNHTRAQAALERLTSN